MTVAQTPGGVSWSELAHRDPLAAVLDPADTEGWKNRAIDRVHKHALARAMRSLQGTAVLDFGCGTGRLSEWLVRQGASVTGVDVTPEMVEVARKRVPDARFEVIEDSSVPYADGAFDLVITAGVLLYYVRGDGAVIRELARVLRADGRAIAIEQVTDSDELGRGGSIQAYEQMFGEGGMRVEAKRAIRIGDSRIIRAVQRHPELLRLRALPRLIESEAYCLKPFPLTSGRYADYVFVARREA
jgi:SAM-dependent methyltransferase